MYTQHSTVNDGTQCHEVKHLATSLPYRGISVLLKAFLVESVHLRNLARLVISADQCYPVRVSEGVSPSLWQGKLERALTWL
jgi:hypothetical protein